MRPLLPCLLLSASALLPTQLLAMEAPLLSSGRNNRIGSVDPGLGTATILQSTTTKLEVLGGVTWRTDLDVLANRIEGNDPTGAPVSALRLGSPNLVPSMQEFFALLPVQAGNGLPSQQLVLDAEQAFWSKPPAYDGKVATSFDGDYLWLAVPSNRTVLVYKVTGNRREPLTLTGWCNYGPFLFLLGAWKSSPSPIEIARELDLSQAERNDLVAHLTRAEDGTSPQPAAGSVWLGSGSKGTVLVDSANQKLISFSMSGPRLKITSVRNLAIDLLVPAYRSLPSDQELVDDYARANASGLQALGITLLDRALLRAINDHSLVGDRSRSQTALEAMVVGDQLVVEFNGRGKMLTYEMRGDSGTRLQAVRDSTATLALAALDRLMVDQGQGAALFRQANQAMADKQDRRALDLLASALAIDARVSAGLGTPSWQDLFKRNPGSDQILAPVFAQAQERTKTWQTIFALAERYRTAAATATEDTTGGTQEPTEPVKPAKKSGSMPYGPKK